MKPLYGSKTRTRVADLTTLPLFAAAAKKKSAVGHMDAKKQRVDVVSLGLPSLDQSLAGGFPVGDVALVAARAKVGTTSLLMGACLHALKHGFRVAYLTQTLRQEQVRGRLVVLESQVNGHRFSGGFVTAEDRVQLAGARERIPWSSLSIMAKRSITEQDAEAHIRVYQPLFVVADIFPKTSTGVTARKPMALLQYVSRLRTIAMQEQVAIAMRMVLPKAIFPPSCFEIPGLDMLTSHAATVLLLHRKEGSSGPNAQAQIIRKKNQDIEPVHVPLWFDGRFAGFVEKSQ